VTAVRHPVECGSCFAGRACGCRTHTHDVTHAHAHTLLSMLEDEEFTQG
jgi:hypothetical protein